VTGRPPLITEEEVLDILELRLERAYANRPQDKPIDEKSMSTYLKGDREAAAAKAKELSDFPGVMRDQNGFKRILPAEIADNSQLSKKFADTWNKKLAADERQVADARQVIMTELRASDDRRHHQVQNQAYAHHSRRDSFQKAVAGRSRCGVSSLRKLFQLC
jgi:hypothetical protein